MHYILTEENMAVNPQALKIGDTIEIRSLFWPSFLLQLQEDLQRIYGIHTEKVKENQTILLRVTKEGESQLPTTKVVGL